MTDKVNVMDRKECRSTRSTQVEPIRRGLGPIEDVESETSEVKTGR